MKNIDFLSVLRAEHIKTVYKKILDKYEEIKKTQENKLREKNGRDERKPKYGEIPRKNKLLVLGAVVVLMAAFFLLADDGETNRAKLTPADDEQTTVEYYTDIQESVPVEFTPATPEDEVTYSGNSGSYQAAQAPARSTSAPSTGGSTSGNTSGSSTGTNTGNTSSTGSNSTSGRNSSSSTSTTKATTQSTTKHSTSTTKATTETTTKATTTKETYPMSLTIIVENRNGDPVDAVINIKGNDGYTNTYNLDGQINVQLPKIQQYEISIVSAEGYTNKQCSYCTAYSSQNGGMVIFTMP